MGTHNVTVYAWDTIGRKGTSETIIFTVSEPSQSLALMGAVASASVAAVAGILLYSKRHKQKMNPPQVS